MSAHASTLKPPGFFRHLLLLWGLRLEIGLNKGKRPSRLLAVASFLASSAPALGLGIGFYRLLTLPVISQSPIWCAFLLNLLCFVTSAVWVTWPLMSAGVDDHSELSRYSAFPISPFRLMFASTLASLLEPRAIVFYAPLVGATAGYAAYHPVPFSVVVPMFIAYAILNAAWSRVGLHMVLNVLRQERSAEIIGVGFVVILFLASLIPPIDTSWLTQVGEEGVEALDLSVLVNAAIALSRVPSGFFGDGVWAASHGRYGVALIDFALILLFTGMGFSVAYSFLLQFHRSIGKAGPPVKQKEDSDPFAKTKTRATTLFVREALDLWRNPRARLLASVPFLLAILLKLLSGKALFVFLLGDAADAWVMGGLAVYGAIVIASTFAQNTFAYDGHGFAVFLAAPMEVGAVMRAKNQLHAGAALLLGLLVSTFFLIYFRSGGLIEWAVAMLAIVGILPVLLTAGNFLSLYFPVKFHASMKRRDKLPFAASMLGVAAASIGAAPFGYALRLRGQERPDGSTLLILTAAAVVGWAMYFAILPIALKLLEQRREIVLRAVTRD